MVLYEWNHWNHITGILHRKAVQYPFLPPQVCPSQDSRFHQTPPSADAYTGVFPSMFPYMVMTFTAATASVSAQVALYT